MPAQGEERGEQVALIAFGIGQETSRVDGTAALARDDKGKVFAGVFVAVLKTGAHIMMQLSSRVPSPSRRLCIFFTM